jgi:D-alanyl-D-alanine dipeptidase
MGGQPPSVMHSFIAITLVVASTALPPIASQPDYVPVSSEAYTADLQVAGFRNGNMPALRLIEVNGCLLERDAAYTLALMVEAATNAGVRLYPGDCYRSLEAQRSAYDRRCPVVDQPLTTYDPATDETVVVGYVKQRKCSGPPIAIPGTSNHGWGRAVDFTSNGRATLGCRDAAFTWLNANAARYGWVHPGWAQCGQSTAEAWHWEWGGVQEALPLPPITISAESMLHRVR